MKFGIKTLDDFNYKGKTVFVRVDINEPINWESGTLRDTSRVEACVPTLKELSDKGAKVVVLAHQGSDIEYKNFYTTLPHSKVLSELLGFEVKFIDDVCGPAARDAIANLKEGEILLLDNVRFMSEEQTLFEKSLKLTHEQQSKTLVVSRLAPLADLYVCDAFAAAHRDQPTLCGFEQILPSAMGRLFEEEYCVLSGIMESPRKPCVFVLGGAKISDAFLIMNSVIESGVADKILTGGLVGQIMHWANGTDIGEASRNFIIKEGYDSLLENGKELLKKFSNRIILPQDVAYVTEGKRYECEAGSISNEQMIIDIGAKTAQQYAEIIKAAKTVFVNGPVGVFENELSEAGTKAVWDALGETEAFTVVGGGDSVAATNKYGKARDISYICTGGGAMIQFLSGKELPVVKALRRGAENKE